MGGGVILGRGTRVAWFKTNLMWYEKRSKNTKYELHLCQIAIQWRILLFNPSYHLICKKKINKIWDNVREARGKSISGGVLKSLCKGDKKIWDGGGQAWGGGRSLDGEGGPPSPQYLTALLTFIWHLSMCHWGKCRDQLD